MKTKYSPRQDQVLGDLAMAYPNPIRYKGTIERTIDILKRDGLVTASLEIMLDALHSSRSRRIWIVTATEKLMALSEYAEYVKKYKGSYHIPDKDVVS